MTAPNKEFLRYGEARDWLKSEGISEKEFLKLIDADVIKPKPLRPSGRAYYFTSQIKRAVLNGAEEQESGTK